MKHTMFRQLAAQYRANRDDRRRHWIRAMTIMADCPLMADAFIDSGMAPEDVRQELWEWRDAECRGPLASKSG